MILLLNLDEILELKQYLAERGGSAIHMHDTCGGQYFTLEAPSAETVRLIQGFLDEKKIKVCFSELADAFTILPGAAL